jgi:hypothetical protein
MTDPRETGRFWLCPECRKHVPTRLDVCSCGFDRTKVPVQMREVSARPPSLEPPASRGSFSWTPWLLVFVLLGWIAYTQVSKPSQPSTGSPPPRPVATRVAPTPPFHMVISESGPPPDVPPGRRDSQYQSPRHQSRRPRSRRRRDSRRRRSFCLSRKSGPPSQTRRLSIR